jgi:hypothetical protein
MGPEISVGSHTPAATEFAKALPKSCHEWESYCDEIQIFGISL